MKNNSDNPNNEDLKTIDENSKNNEDLKTINENSKNKDLVNRIKEFEKNWVYREPAPRYNRD